MHCLVSVCGLLVVVVAAAVAIIVNIDVDDVPRVRKSEMKRRREGTRKDDGKLIVARVLKSASAFLKALPHI